jgi:hypothetical protein
LPKKAKMKLSPFLLQTLAGPASAALSGTFSVLSFNVAGLPEIINGNDVPGDKTTNTEIIGERFVEYGYDIIQVQEVHPLYPIMHHQAISKTKLRTSTTTQPSTAQQHTLTAPQLPAASPLARD